MELPQEISEYVTSNYNPGKAFLAIDKNIETRWCSGHPRVEGMSFEIEIPRTYLLSKIEIKLGKFTTDYSEAMNIEVSEDGKKWRGITFTTHMEGMMRWERGQPRYFFGHEAVVLFHSFEPVMARFVRLTLTGSHPVFDWSIPEISLFSPSGD